MRTLLPILLLLPTLAHSWEHYGGDLAGTRFVPNSIIDATNVSRLQKAWQYRTGDYSDGAEFKTRPYFKATPLLVDNKLVFSTGFNRVIALEPETAEVLWSFDPKLDFAVGFSEAFTSRGISVWQDRHNTKTECSKRIYLGTLDARLIALDLNTGQRSRLPVNPLRPHGRCRAAPRPFAWP